jgi:hypothetical protein
MRPRYRTVLYAQSKGLTLLTEAIRNVMNRKHLAVKSQEIESTLEDVLKQNEPTRVHPRTSPL